MSSLPKKLVICVSLANLCLLSVWKNLDLGNLHPYHLGDGDAHRLAIASFAALALISLIYWTMLTLLDGARGASVRALAESLLFLSLVIPINGFRHVISGTTLADAAHHLHPKAVAILGTIVLLGTAALIFKWHHAASRIVLSLALVASPFFLVTTTKVFLYARQATEGRGQYVQASMASARPTPQTRIVWLVFDEMDYRLALAEPPAGLHLPHFERLAAESFSAENAVAPSRNTSEAMPSLINGRIVAQAQPEGVDELMLKYAGQNQPVPWSAETTVFSKARALGYQTAIVGWYHPYNRVLGRDLNYCLWIPWTLASGNKGIFWYLLYELQTITPGIVARNLFYREQLEKYHRVKQAAQNIIPDRRYGLVLVHWPIPHQPFIYDRQRARFDGTASPDGYLGNLVLTDITLGEIRGCLASAGLWDTTTLIVTADHFWRDSRSFDSKEDHRVPFLIKLPGQTNGLKYRRPLNTVLTRGIIEAILKSELSTPEDLCRWLDTTPPIPGSGSCATRIH